MNIFSLILVIATAVTFVFWVYDYKVKRPGRLEKLNAKLAAGQAVGKKERKESMEPTGLLGQLASLFPIILLVFVIRSFVVEPFRIPSGSMMPTLLSGDFIAVSKFSYAIKNPLTNATLIETGEPQRGDVIVFKYPEDPAVDYIKRIVGMPGDEIIYRNKHIFVRSACTAQKCDPPQPYPVKEAGTYTEEGLGFTDTYLVYEEQVGDHVHQMMINPLAPDFSQYFYHQDGQPVGSWKVPEGCFFAMGDNRDNSRDSRFWGVVPKENIVGKTVGIWMSFDFDESSDGILPSWIPSGIRFSRIGGID